jgi:hypothetical protein
MLTSFYIHTPIVSNEIWALFAYYAAYSGNSLKTFQNNLSHHIFLVPDNGTDRKSRNVGKKITTLRSGISHKSAYLICVAPVAWNHPGVDYFMNSLKPNAIFQAPDWHKEVSGVQQTHGYYLIFSYRSWERQKVTFHTLSCIYHCCAKWLLVLPIRNAPHTALTCTYLPSHGTATHARARECACVCNFTDYLILVYFVNEWGETVSSYYNLVLFANCSSYWGTLSIFLFSLCTVRHFPQLS